MVLHPRSPRTLTAVAIGALFGVNGFLYASWVPRLIEIRRDLEMTDTILGFTLLGAGIGGLLMSLGSGVIINRFGSRTIGVASALALAAVIPVIPWAPTPLVLFSVMLVFGATDGLTDVAANAQAINFQATSHKSVLTRMHAVWSIGALTGGLIATWTASIGIAFEVQMATVAVVSVAIIIWLARHLLPTDPPASEHLDHNGERRRLPRLLLAGMFGAGVLAILAEMPPTEWGTLLMSERFDVSIGVAGLGFVAFSAGMVMARLVGDLAVDRLGPEPFRRLSAAVSFTGVLAAVFGPIAEVALLGLFITGSGTAALFPLAIRRAGELVSGAVGIAMFSSGARAGILLGPVTMGVLSDQTSRATALLVVAGGATAAMALIRLPEPRVPQPEAERTPV